jgi:hypothetical protein
MGQLCDCFYISLVKVGLGDPPHGPCAMDHDIRITDQPLEAIEIFECALNPLDRGASKAR